MSELKVQEGAVIAKFIYRQTKEVESDSSLNKHEQQAALDKFNFGRVRQEPNPE
jgi:hypothetical protein